MAEMKMVPNAVPGTDGDKYIPMEERKRRKEDLDDYEDEQSANKKQSSRIATIVGLCVLAILLAIGIYLIGE